MVNNSESNKKINKGEFLMIVATRRYTTRVGRTAGSSFCGDMLEWLDRFDSLILSDERQALDMSEIVAKNRRYRHVDLTTLGQVDREYHRVLSTIGKKIPKGKRTPNWILDACQSVQDASWAPRVQHSTTVERYSNRHDSSVYAVRDVEVAQYTETQYQTITCLDGVVRRCPRRYNYVTTVLYLEREPNVKPNATCYNVSRDIWFAIQ